MVVGDNVQGGNAGNTATVVLPIVRDITPNALTVANTLADINDSSYRLRRIVGKFWCFTDQIAQDGPVAIAVTAGFIILRTDPQSLSVPQNNNPDSYATTDILNAESPWIWRRTYLVRNLLANGAINQSVVGVNAQAFGFGGVADGPHIDQKTARIVGPDSRLFLVVSATTIFASDPQIGAPLTYIYDLRVLASMRSTVGNRRNATR